MIYYLYKITNKINGKFYIGKRQTEADRISLDPYMGSGIRIKAAIEKYGIENFTKEILGTCSSPEMLNVLEALEVTEELVNDPNCYNLMLGGHGGRQGPEARKKISESKMGDKNPMKHKVWSDEDRRIKSEAAKMNSEQKTQKRFQTMLAQGPTYIVIHPDGSEETLTELLTQFCNKHKLDQRTMKAIAEKRHTSDRKKIPTAHKGFSIYIKE